MGRQNSIWSVPIELQFFPHLKHNGLFEMVLIYAVSNVCARKTAQIVQRGTEIEMFPMYICYNSCITSRNQ